MRALSSLTCFLVAVLILGGLSGCSRDARVTRHLTRANTYYDAGKLQLAEVEYTYVLRLNPQNKQSILRLASIYFDQGNPNKAYPFLRTAADLYPDDLDVRVRLATLYLAGRRFRDARAQADYILEKQPRHDEAILFLAETARSTAEIQDTRNRLESLRPDCEKQPGFHVALGTLAFREKHYTNAESAFAHAVALDPKYLPASSALGNLYSVMDRPGDAEQAFKRVFEMAPQRSARRLDYIDFKAKAGDLAAAKQLLEKVRAEAPDVLPVLNRSAELELAGRNFPEVKRLAGYVLNRDPQNFDALMLVGRLHLAQGDPAGAAAHLERVKLAHPRLPQVPYHLALAYLAQNNTPAAVRNLHDSTLLDPEFPDPVLVLAELDLRKGDALSAITALTGIIKKRASLPQAYLLLAAAHRARNNLPDAVSVYRRFIQLYPRNAQGPLFLGSVYLQQKQTNEARRLTEQALALSPGFLPALEQLITLDLGAKRFDDAFNRLQAEIEKQPRAAVLYVLLAKIFMARGETNQVEVALLKAINLDPNAREAYLLLAHRYVEQRQHPEAIAKLQRALEQNPRDVPALMLLGMIYNQIKERVAERDVYLRLLSVNPNFSPALNNLAYLFSEHFNELDRAYDMAVRARELLPYDPYAADTLGWILFKRREYSWALSLFQESAQRLPDHPELLFHLGMAHYFMGNEDSARASLQRAAQSTTDFPGKQECQRRLSTLAIDVSQTADAALEESLRSQPGDPVALSRLASLYARRGELERARAVCEDALAVNPKNVSVTLQLVQLYVEPPQNLSRAIDLAGAARAFAPENAAVTHTLARLLFQRGQPLDYSWSLSLLQESARKLPGDAAVGYDLAWAAYVNGRLDDATNTMRSVARSASGSLAGKARQFLAVTALYGQPYKSVESEVAAAVKADPEFLPALLANAARQEQQGNWATARSLFEKIIERYPDFTPALKHLSRLYLEHAGDLEKAYAYASKAREAIPNDSSVSKTLGIICYHRREYRRATVLLAESTRHAPAEPESLYFLGMAHYRLRELASARPVLSNALALNLRADLAANASEALAELNRPKAGPSAVSKVN